MTGKAGAGKLLWQLRDDRSWQFRLDHVHDPRIGPINRLVESLRVETEWDIPWVDPFCGGIAAKILLVLKRPGPAGATSANFLSLADADHTARNTVVAMQQAGLRYEDLVFWNAIPWPGPRGEKITAAMRREGAPMFRRLLPLLVRLQVVILIGKDAHYLRPVAAQIAALHIIECPHTSPLAWNQKNHRDRIMAAFREAALMAG